MLTSSGSSGPQDRRRTGQQACSAAGRKDGVCVCGVCVVPSCVPGKYCMGARVCVSAW